MAKRRNLGVGVLELEVEGAERRTSIVGLSSEVVNLVAGWEVAAVIGHNLCHEGCWGRVVQCRSLGQRQGGEEDVEQHTGLFWVGTLHEVLENDSKKSKM